MLKRFLFFILIIVFPRVLIAEQGGPFSSALSGDLEAMLQTLPENGVLRAAQHSVVRPMKFNLKVGRKTYALKFTRVRPKSWPAFFDYGGYLEEDPTEMTLFSGSAFRNGRKHLAGATLQRRDGTTSVSVYFRGEGKRSRSRLIKAKLNFSSKGRTRAVANGLYAAIPSVMSALECGSEPASQPRVAALTTLPLTGSIYRFEMATDADYEFFQKYGENANSVIATYFNIIDSLFNYYLRLDSEIVVQSVFASPNQPYTKTSPAALLTEFQSYRTLTAPLAESPDLHHLFTGKDIDGGVAGIAWEGAACLGPEYSFGLSQDFGVAGTPIVAAHEIGHNFGAGHLDPVQVPKPGIMSPSLNLDSPPDYFAEETRVEIESHLQTYGDLCLTDTGIAPPLAPPAITTPTPPPGSGETGIYIGVSFNKAGVFTAEVELDEAMPECEVVLYVAKSNAALATPTEIGRAAATDYLTYFSAQMSERVKGLKAKVKVFATLQCGGSVVSESDILNLKVGRALALDKVSKPVWIDLLNGRI